MIELIYTTHMPAKIGANLKMIKNVKLKVVLIPFVTSE